MCLNRRSNATACWKAVLPYFRLTLFNLKYMYLCRSLNSIQDLPTKKPKIFTLIFVNEVASRQAQPKGNNCPAGWLAGSSTPHLCIYSFLEREDRNRETKMPISNNANNDTIYWYINIVKVGRIQLLTVRMNLILHLFGVWLGTVAVSRVRVRARACLAQHKYALDPICTNRWFGDPVRIWNSGHICYRILRAERD